MSRRLALLSLFLRLVARPRLSRVADPVAARADFDRTARWMFRAPPFATILPGRVGGTEGIPEVPGLWVSCGRVHPRRVILYFHGGGYVTGSAATHAPMVARLSKVSGLRAFVPDYRRAPEHPFPAALEDARAAWQGLYALGYEPRDIVIAGDSAGGGLAFALLAELCATDRQPAMVVGFAPWVDMTGRGASITQNAERDALLPARRFGELAGLYAGRTPRDDPRVSPLFADFPGAPPVLLQVSEDEILRDDTLRLERKLKRFGAEVTVQTWPGAPHVFQVFDGWVPEAREALSLAGEAIRARFAPPPHAPARFIPRRPALAPAAGGEVSRERPSGES
ncbi:alpha/beta hydrolase [Acidimangrovimonas sediminis]|uniref:alpha/beta hydrolase n=1 Tax=Acidimangrovimonas sediminis TaxID=2056283 RepID=UPI000C7FED44|nr:alpha/beta hydrolase [Acidimangrovimonas sediminis]